MTVRLRGVRAAGEGGAPLLDGVDLDVADGERVLLAGPSGAGKSTLLRLLAGVLDEGLDVTGEVTVAGGAGLLVQDPLDAAVAATSGRDTAFGPENLGLDRATTWARVAAAHAAARFPAGPERPVGQLSGGERQRLAVAGVLALRPRVLLLDEPTSMLDAATARAVRDALLESAGGRTLLVVDHDLTAWAPHVDRVVVLGRGGRVVADGTPDLLDPRRGDLDELGLWTPGAPAPEALAVPDGLLAPALPVRGDVLTARGVEVVRRRRGLRPGPSVRVLHGVDATLTAGATTALTGPSGSGKSTLLAVLAGVLRPSAGSVRAAPDLVPGRATQPWRWRSRDLAARLAWAPQHPEHAFVRHTVREEVRATALATGRAVERADALLEVLSLDHRADANPFQLSGGEQRRLVLAGALAAGPAVLLADEPSVGQDRGTWAAVAGLLSAAAGDGAAVAVSTHDERLVAAVAGRRRVHLDAGRTAVAA